MSGLRKLINERIELFNILYKKIDEDIINSSKLLKNCEFEDIIEKINVKYKSRNFNEITLNNEKYQAISKIIKYFQNSQLNESVVDQDFFKSETKNFWKNCLLIEKNIGETEKKLKFVNSNVKK